MTVAWIGVGTAVLGAGASISGAKKQADASKKGAQLQMDQFNTLNRQQQPYIQSGYGALGKLNTLLGIGSGGGGASRPTAPAVPSMQPPNGLTVNNGPNGPGVHLPPRLQMGPQTQSFGAPPGASNLPLRHILTMRAQNGDTEAARVLRGLV